MNQEIDSLHSPLMRWLRQEGILFRHSNSSKRTSEACGEPDFLILQGGRVLPLEFKVEKKGRLSAAQVRRHADYEDAGCKVHVVTSYAVALELIQEWRRHEPPLPATTPRSDLRQHNGYVFQCVEEGFKQSATALRKCGPADAGLPKLFPAK